MRSPFRNADKPLSLLLVASLGLSSSRLPNGLRQPLAGASGSVDFTIALTSLPMLSCWLEQLPTSPGDKYADYQH